MKQVRFVILILCAAVFFSFNFTAAEPILNSAVQPEADTSDEYRIGEDDVLHISVFQRAELTKDVTVRPDGKISYDLIGTIQAAGRTTSELDSIIAEALSRYVRNPQVTVTVKEFRSRSVLVFGEVARPGNYPLKGSTRLLDILTQAGWKPDPQINKLNVMRADGTVVRVDLDALLYQASPTENIALRGGDVIFIPKLTKTEAALKKVMIYGEFNKKGAIDYPKSGVLRVRDIMLLSEGVTATSALERARLIRADGTTITVNLKELIYDGNLAEDYVLKPGDAIYLPRINEINVFVLGMVNRPGLYVVNERPNVLQALTYAQYYRFGAVLSSTKVVRGDPNNPQIISVDLKKLLFEGDRKQNIRLESGDVIFVPQNFISSITDFLRNVWSPISTSLDAYSRVQAVADGRYVYYGTGGVPR